MSSDPQFADLFLTEAPVVPALFRQAGVVAADASNSMLEEVDTLLGKTKADAVGLASSELIGRFKVSRKAANFSFGFVDFHDTVSAQTPIQSVSDVDEYGDFNPTRNGTGGTFIGSGLEAAHQMAVEFLDDPTADLPSSVVVLVLTDGEDLQPDPPEPSPTRSRPTAGS